MMRFTKLNRISQLLEQIVKRENYYIYIAPLNLSHYEKYIEIINSRYLENVDLRDVLVSEKILREAVSEINVRTDILIDTNLYVSRLDSDNFEFANELLIFLKERKIEYWKYLGDKELINELENRPKDQMNRT